MDYTAIHIYGHILTDDILHAIETDESFDGNKAIDFHSSDLAFDIDYAWSCLRNDYNFFYARNNTSDTYGTRRARDLIGRLLTNLGYQLKSQNEHILVDNVAYGISFLDEKLNNFPVHIVGDIAKDELNKQLDGNTLDLRVKGKYKQRSPHATMQAYLNATDNTYGIIANGKTIRLIRSSGQLVKLNYIEFDIKKMVEEDKYKEFCLLYRLLHCSRFVVSNNNSCIFERWFNKSIESGHRIRDGLSNAVKNAMLTIINAAMQNDGEGNERLRNEVNNKFLSLADFNKELIHFIYRLLFLFIIEDRKLIFDRNDKDQTNSEDVAYYESIYYQYYAVSNLRHKSEIDYLRNPDHNDLWQGLMDTFRLFESGSFGKSLGIAPLGGVLFGRDTLKYLQQCNITNEQLLEAFSSLDEFYDDKGNKVRINYSSLDVEEFGSVYEGILEMRPYLNADNTVSYVNGLDRKTTASYYTRPDLVQALIKTTLEPAIQERLKEHKGNIDAQIKSLLSMRVCDPACGSGHFVLAMARTLAWHICSLRTGEDNPASSDYRHALHEVIANCVYAVDLNPDAVELCKLVLWIEGYCAGKPLSFLDHHIRCGNSVLGLGLDFDMLLKGVPNDAFNINSKNKALKKELHQANKDALKYFVESSLNKDLSPLEQAQQFGLFQNPSAKFNINEVVEQLGALFAKLSDLPGDTEEQELAKQEYLNKLKSSEQMQALYNAANIYTYAYFKEFNDNDLISITQPSTLSDYSITISPNIPYTATVYQALDQLKDDHSHTKLNQALVEQATQAAQNYHFFHWALEFPDIYAQGGFDVMCGNPPWEKIKIEDKQWFNHECEQEIAESDNADKRNKLIAQLSNTNPALHNKYLRAKNSVACTSKFLRFSNRFELTAKGDIDLYPLFAEHLMNLCKDIWGIIVPTGVATNDSNKDFFQVLTKENRLVSLYDFTNKNKLFDIASNLRFCLISAHQAQAYENNVTVGFMLNSLDNILDNNRVYHIKTNDFAKFNPNTKTWPIFNTSYDATLTSKIYDNSSIIIKENSAGKTADNPWNIKFSTMFHMSNDSKLFKTYEDLTNAGATIKGDSFVLNDNLYVPLMEAKLFWHYNHHYSAFPIDVEKRPGAIPNVSCDELQDVNFALKPWYWINSTEVEHVKSKGLESSSFVIAFRDIARSTDARTMIACIMPNYVALNNKSPSLVSTLALSKKLNLLAILNSLTFDYATRQKITSANLNFFIVKQLPVLRPEQIDEVNQWQLVKRVAELTYFNHDMDEFAKELSAELSQEQNEELGNRLIKQEPWVFDELRRAQLQAEIDAIVAKLYGLNDDELKYILDPEDIFGVGCIHETFRVLKNNEIKEFGEYRTKRLVLEAWDKLNQGNLF